MAAFLLLMGIAISWTLKQDYMRLEYYCAPFDATATLPGTGTFPTPLTIDRDFSSTNQ